jgi:hypothetical protein
VEGQLTQMMQQSYLQIFWSNLSATYLNLYIHLAYQGNSQIRVCQKLFHEQYQNSMLEFQL